MLIYTVALQLLLWLIDVQRRLMSVIGMLRKAEGTFTLSLQSEISVQWAAVVGRGPLEPATQADLDNISARRAAAFSSAVLQLHAGIGVFCADIVLPSLFLMCDPPDGWVFYLILYGLMRNLARLGFLTSPVRSEGMPAFLTLRERFKDG